jgi:predicted nucleotidyltransferase
MQRCVSKSRRCGDLRTPSRTAWNRRTRSGSSGDHASHVANARVRRQALAVSELADVVPALLRRSAHVTGVELRGSRARGEAGPFSDWDFVVWTDDFQATAADLPLLVKSLRPLQEFWDPLSEVPCFQLMLAGPIKVDLIFEARTYAIQPPWTVTAQTLPGIDAHFWDWTLWLTSKVDAGKKETVSAELEKMFGYLLVPMGAQRPPSSLGGAIDQYLRLRTEAERRHGVVLDAEPGRQVIGVVARLGAM